MKFLALIVYVFVMLSLVSKLEARQRFYCLWSTKRTCSRTSPQCLRLQSGVDPQNNAVYTCKYYRDDCKYLLDKCKGSTAYGQKGTSVKGDPYCIVTSIAKRGTSECT
ncbi:GD20594 [Drosophila simulans]|uniref:GD20594 n=1 Tax=Drosophila simulans TaxID=7240 RepID=B4NVB1_DROSI|nr:GD20594 [Drosophila simulans]